MDISPMYMDSSTIVDSHMHSMLAEPSMSQRSLIKQEKKEKEEKKKI